MISYKTLTALNVAAGGWIQPLALGFKVIAFSLQ